MRTAPSKRHLRPQCAAFDPSQGAKEGKLQRCKTSVRPEGVGNEGHGRLEEADGEGSKTPSHLGHAASVDSLELLDGRPV